MKIIDNDLLSIQESRILAENAREAQEKLALFPQEKLDAIVERMAEEIEAHARELAEMSCEETGYGNPDDKYLKDMFICREVLDSMRGLKCVGVIDRDTAKGTTDYGIPIGVFAAMCAATSPVSTTVFYTLLAIKSGNAIIFSPHPRAKETITRTLDIMIKAGEGYGLPECAVSYLRTISKAGTIELMNHKDVSAIMISGVPHLRKAAVDTGKYLLFSGTGNGPAFIEASADVDKAVSDIIFSKTFDNGVVSGAEQAVVVDAGIDEKVRKTFASQGGYFMDSDEAKKLSRVFYRRDGSPDPETIGKTAEELAGIAGFKVPEWTKILLSEKKFVFREQEYEKERLSPILTYYVEKDWEHACEKIIKLLVEEEQASTLILHSSDRTAVEKLASNEAVQRVLVNTPAVLGNMGFTTSLVPAMTLGSGRYGCEMTGDNISPLRLVYIRKVAYGVRTFEEAASRLKAGKQESSDSSADRKTDINAEAIREMLLQMLNK